MTFDDAEDYCDERTVFIPCQRCEAYRKRIAELEGAARAMLGSDSEEASNRLWELVFMEQ